MTEYQRWIVEGQNLFSKLYEERNGAGSYARYLKQQAAEIDAQWPPLTDNHGASGGIFDTPEMQAALAADQEKLDSMR